MLETEGVLWSMSPRGTKHIHTKVLQSTIGLVRVKDISGTHKPLIWRLDGACKATFGSRLLRTKPLCGSDKASRLS